MTNKHSVTDNGDLLRYYAAIPNIVFDLGLNPYELALYGHFKRAAGNGKGAACWKSRATIAKESGMSSGMVTKARQTLEMPRPELGGKALITVTDEPSKTGGKPTCRVLITDVWAVNMTRYSTSPHDGATSHHDVDPLAPSPHDVEKGERRHHTTLATSPHVPKEEPLKKKKEEHCAHARLMAFHAEHIEGEIPNPGAQGAAVKFLLKNFTPEDCEAVYAEMYSEQWRTTPVSWLQVQKEIGSRLKRRGETQPANGGKILQDWGDMYTVMGADGTPSKRWRTPEAFARDKGLPLEEVLAKWN